MTRHGTDPPRPRRGRSKRTGIEKTSATVIGLGGIGRQVAHLLTALGVGRLQLVDARQVSIKTHGREGYALEDANRRRVYAVADKCHPVNPQLNLETVNTLSIRGIDLGDAAFLCPGGYAAIQRVTDSIGDTLAFAARCTVDRSTIRVDIARDRHALENWPKQPPASRLTHPVTSVPAESMAAALAVDQFVRYATGQRPRSLRLDLTTLRLDVVG